MAVTFGKGVAADQLAGDTSPRTRSAGRPADAWQALVRLRDDASPSLCAHFGVRAKFLVGRLLRPPRNDFFKLPRGGYSNERDVGVNSV